MKRYLTFICLSAASGHAFSENLASGEMAISIDQAASAASTVVTTLEAFFSTTESRAECLSGPGLSFNAANLAYPVLPALITNPPVGRALQATTVDLDPSDIFGSWTPATMDFGMLVIGGEQIGLGGMMRWTGNFTGKLIFGDFALRYSPSRSGVLRQGSTLSGLVLTSNIDFGNAAYADLANIIVSPVVNRQFTITGDLVYSDGFAALAGDAGDAGVDFGDFTFTGHFAVNNLPKVDITRLPSGDVQLGFAASNGASYRVQYSENLSQWTTVDDSLQGASGVVTWLDAGLPGVRLHPSQVAKRFYRIYKEP